MVALAIPFETSPELTEPSIDMSHSTTAVSSDTVAVNVTGSDWMTETGDTGPTVGSTVSGKVVVVIMVVVVVSGMVVVVGTVVVVIFSGTVVVVVAMVVVVMFSVSFVPSVAKTVADNVADTKM